MSPFRGFSAHLLGVAAGSDLGVLGWLAITALTVPASMITAALEVFLSGHAGTAG